MNDNKVGLLQPKQNIKCTRVETVAKKKLFDIEENEDNLLKKLTKNTGNVINGWLQNISTFKQQQCNMNHQHTLNHNRLRKVSYTQKNTQKTESESQNQPAIPRLKKVLRQLDSPFRRQQHPNKIYNPIGKIILTPIDNNSQIPFCSRFKTLNLKLKNYRFRKSSQESKSRVTNFIRYKQNKHRRTCSAEPTMQDEFQEMAQKMLIIREAGQIKK